mgnify:CR=1 FL=1
MSVFTLGTMRALESPQQMAAVLEAAIDAGINHLETAPAYGPAERFLGEALPQLAARAPGTHAGLVLTSKLLPGSELSDGQAQLRQILKRLGVSRLDNLAVHGLNRPEHLAWATAGPGRELLAWALGEGLVVQVGFSSHGSNALIEQARRAETARRWDLASQKWSLAAEARPMDITVLLSTAAAILEAVRQQRQRTILMVSHQLSAAAACDRILVLDGGRLVQRGHHNTLVHQSGTYRRLWEREQAEQQLSRAA